MEKIYTHRFTVRLTKKEHKDVIRLAKLNKKSISRLLVESATGWLQV